MKKSKTPSFQLELQLLVNPGQARSLRAYFEAARVLYNAFLGEALKRLHHLRTDPAWQAARSWPRTQKRERAAAFSCLREHYSFSEYAIHAFAKEANCTWIADHIDSTMAQTLATRAYQAVNRVCLGKAKKVRFRSKGRGLDSVQNKRNNTGLRFVLQSPEEGNQGWLICGKDQIPALIGWNDLVVKHGLGHRIKYARLVRRKASSPRAKGADVLGYRYSVQLVLEGIPSSAQYTLYWESAELRLRAALEVLTQRAKEGQVLPRSVGISRAGARLPKNLANTQQELVYLRGRLEALQ